MSPDIALAWMFVVGLGCGGVVAFADTIQRRRHQRRTIGAPDMVLSALIVAALDGAPTLVIIDGVSQPLVVTLPLLSISAHAYVVVQDHIVRFKPDLLYRVAHQQSDPTAGTMTLTLAHIR